MSRAIASGGTVVARPWTRRKFYVAMSVVLIGMIFVGFWPTYYGWPNASAAHWNAKASWRVMPKAAVSSDGLVLPNN
jgi:hypothetical protein